MVGTKEVIRLFRDLNNRYFDLFSDLDACRAVLPTKQYETMANALRRAYDRDLEEILGQKELETARSTFEMRYRLRHYVPRRSLFGWNRVARALKKECLREFREYLAQLTSVPPEPEEDPAGSSAGPVSGLPVPTDKPELPL